MVPKLGTKFSQHRDGIPGISTPALCQTHGDALVVTHLPMVCSMVRDGSIAFPVVCYTCYSKAPDPEQGLRTLAVILPQTFGQMIIAQVRVRKGCVDIADWQIEGRTNYFCAYAQ